MAPWARRLGCVLACCAQIGRGRSRETCDLPMRRNEGRVVNTPLVFKRVLCRREKSSEKRTKKSGENGRKEKEGRRREERQGRTLGLEWKKTMNAGGFEIGI
ncbi:hypothetical protein TNCV_1139031 [Trichonephila clavipes]|nr:hypothetical protein TNCV_1139031 [Trichonephila clavipes]